MEMTKMEQKVDQAASFKMNLFVDFQEFLFRMNGTDPKTKIIKCTHTHTFSTIVPSVDGIYNLFFFSLSNTNQMGFLWLVQIKMLRSDAIIRHVNFIKIIFKSDVLSRENVP